ncbi:MAG: phosphoglycolate phosphatase [Dasania sp.]|jgi:phosphoglycolate phosphatase
MTLFVFDFDGTLSDSAHFICDTMHDAFVVHNIVPPTHNAIRNIIGISLEEAIFKLNSNLSRFDLEKVTQSYRDIFRQKRADNLMKDTLFDGTIEILDMLKASPHLSAIATGKSLRGLDAELDRHNIRDYFCAYQTSDTHPSKPHPAMLETVMMQAGALPTDTIMIGDTSYDMMMAKSAGTTAIGVSWGCHDVDTLKKSGADHIITHFSDLKSYIL